MFFSWDIQFLDLHFARVLWVWVCSFVCLSYVGPFFITFFPWLGHYCFLIFCLKLSDHKYSKLTKWNFFEKILAWPKMGQKAQNGSICQFVHYYSIFLRIFSLVFFYILHRVERPLVLKTDGAKFFGKIIACTKAGQKGPQWSNLSICLLLQHFSQDWLISVFLWKRAKNAENDLICLLVHYGGIFSQDWLIRFVSIFWYFVWTCGTKTT